MSPIVPALLACALALQEPAAVEPLLGAAAQAAAEGRWEEAEKHASRARDAAVGRADAALEARARRLLGRILLDRADLGRAREELARAAEIDARLGLSRELVEELRWLGDLEFRSGDYSAALGRYEHARRSATEAGLAAPVSRAEIGALLSNLGRYAEARAELSAALDEARAASDPEREAYALCALGTLESARGDYGEAIRRIEAAVGVARAAESDLAEASAEVMLAGVLAELQRDGEAEEAVARALEHLDAGGTPVQHAYALLTLALVRVDAGRAAAALDPLSLAREEMERIGHAAGVADAIELAARANVELGRPSEAEALWRDAERRRAALGAPFARAVCLSGLAESLEAQHRMVDARAAFREALALAAPLEHPAATWRACAGLARAAESLGPEGEAESFHERAISEIERMRSRIGSSSLRSGFLADKLEVFRRAARHAARHGEIERAFRWTEAGKARTLLEICTAPRERGPSTTSDAAQHAAELALLELRYAEALQQGCSEGSRAEFRRRIRGVRAEVEAGRAEAERKNPRHWALAGASRALPGLSAVQARLPPDAALLEYLIGPRDSAVWVVTRSAAQLVDLAASAADIEALARRIHRPIELLRAGRADLANLRFDAAAARELHARLIAPIAEHIAGIEMVWIVPDGPLTSLPFALLVSAREIRPVDPARPHAQYLGCRFLVEDFALGVLPAAGLLALARAERGVAPSAEILVADPEPRPIGVPALLGARDEITAVLASLSAQRSRLLCGVEAREDRVKDEVRRALRIHLSTHAVLDDRRPAYSRIALAPGGGEDGWLHAFEVEDLELAGARVVLSGCETAGTASRGEGLLGLTRAFLQAGARSVVATLWAIDDQASAFLMRRYYQALERGSDGPRALREAQVATLRQGCRDGLLYVQPFFWASFVHVGSPE